jgi:UDP-GlcNAc3NAcA epimerase
MNNGKLINNNNFHFSALTDHPLHPFVANVGDVMYDVLLKAMEIVQRRSKILEEYQITNKEYYLLTLHRAENTDVPERLEKIINFVNDVSVGKTVICPMHPRTMKVYGHTKKKFMPNIKTVEPVGYFDILMLMKNTALIMTDSGGMQKEAYWLQVPCVTLREETEWVETVQSGWNVLYRNYNGLHKPSDKNTTYYGDGKAAERIVRTLITNIQVNK